MTVPARSGATERPEPKEWLTRYLRLQQRYDVKVDELLRDAAAEAERELDGLASIGPSAVVRSATILQAVTAISQALSGVWMEMGDLVRAGQADARAVALKMAFDWDRVLLYSVIEPGKRAAMKNSLVEGARFNVEAALTRVYLTRIPLAEQVYKTAEMTRGWVEHRVTTSIARGRTVDQLAKDVRAFINPATPGGASYAARRLARTEINNTYHAVIVVHNEDKPWVNGMKWNTSRSHPKLDICDTLARNDKHGLGRGVFPRTAVPRKPHPQCLCYITPRTMTNDQFVKAWKAGNFRDYVARTYES
jgi:hypothetical protein